MSNPLRWFIDLNKKCFSYIEKLFPNTIESGRYYYSWIKDSLTDNCTLIDIGGGRNWYLASERSKYKGLKLIVVDPSEEELSYNHDADEKVIFAMGTEEKAPIDDNTADIVTANMVLEHISNNDYTMRDINRILKPGGKFIAVMPNKFALFALINQMIPNWLLRKIMFSIMPETEGTHGFKTYYDRTYYPAMQKLLTRYGFVNTKFEFTYYQSSYFAFFLPFGIISLIWDFLMYLFRIRPLCAHLCFMTYKKS